MIQSPEGPVGQRLWMQPSDPLAVYDGPCRRTRHFGPGLLEDHNSSLEVTFS